MRTEHAIRRLDEAGPEQREDHSLVRIANDGSQSEAPRLPAGSTERRRADETQNLLTASGAFRDDLAGRVIGGRFEVHGTLATDSFGLILSGIDRKTERPVSLRVVRSVRVASRLGAQLSAVSSFTHPNLLAALGVLRSGRQATAATPAAAEGGILIVQGALEGRSVASQIEAHRLDGTSVDLTEACHIVTTVADALTAVRASGPHGAVGAETVWVDGKGGVLLTDLVLSRALLESADDGSDGQEVRRTLFLAPEVKRGGLPQTASDVYGLSALLYWLLTGRPPVEGGVVPSRAHAEVGRSLDMVIKRGLSADPKHRHASPEALQTALLAALRTDKREAARSKKQETPRTELPILFSQGPSFQPSVFPAPPAPTSPASPPKLVSTAEAPAPAPAARPDPLLKADSGVVPVEAPPAIHRQEIPSTRRREVTPPVAQQVTPPAAKQVTPPVAKEVTPPVAKEVAPAVAKEVAPPPAKQVTPPPAKQVTPPPAKQVTPPVTEQAPPAGDIGPPALEKSEVDVEKVDVSAVVISNQEVEWKLSAEEPLPLTAQAIGSGRPDLVRTQVIRTSGWTVVAVQRAWQGVATWLRIQAKPTAISLARAMLRAAKAVAAWLRTQAKPTALSMAKSTRRGAAAAAAWLRTQAKPTAISMAKSTRRGAEAAAAWLKTQAKPTAISMAKSTRRGAEAAAAWLKSQSRLAMLRNGLGLLFLASLAVLTWVQASAEHDRLLVRAQEELSAIRKGFKRSEAEQFLLTQANALGQVSFVLDTTARDKRGRTTKASQTVWVRPLSALSLDKVGQIDAHARPGSAVTVHVLDEKALASSLSWRLTRTRQRGAPKLEEIELFWAEVGKDEVLREQQVADLRSQSLAAQKALKDSRRSKNRLAGAPRSASTVRSKAQPATSVKRQAPRRRPAVRQAVLLVSERKRASTEARALYEEAARRAESLRASPAANVSSPVAAARVTVSYGEAEVTFDVPVPVKAQSVPVTPLGAVGLAATRATGSWNTLKELTPEAALTRVAKSIPWRARSMSLLGLEFRGIRLLQVLPCVLLALLGLVWLRMRRDAQARPAK